MVQKQPGYTEQIPAFGNLPKWKRIQSDYTARRGNYLLPPLFYSVMKGFSNNWSMSPPA